MRILYHAYLKMESIETVNRTLELRYGNSLYIDLPKFRVVRCEDQFETRDEFYIEYSDTGLYLGERNGPHLTKKYGYLPPQWILEKLCDVPEGTELTVKQSYECIWAFGTVNPGNCIDSITFLIDTVLEKIHGGKNGIARYKHPEEEMQTKEAIRDRIDKLKKLLFQDETPLADAIHFGEGVSVPHKEFVKENE